MICWTIWCLGLLSVSVSDHFCTFRFLHYHLIKWFFCCSCFSIQRCLIQIPHCCLPQQIMVYYGSWCVAHTLSFFVLLQKTSFRQLLSLYWVIFLIPTHKGSLRLILLEVLAFTEHRQLALKRWTCFLSLRTRVVHQVLTLLKSLNW